MGHTLQCFSWPYSPGPKWYGHKTVFSRKGRRRQERCNVCLCVWNGHPVTGPAFHTALVSPAKDEHSACLLACKVTHFVQKLFIYTWLTERWHDWNLPQSWETRLKYNEPCIDDTVLVTEGTLGTLAGRVNGAMKWTIPVFFQSLLILPWRLMLWHMRFFMWKIRYLFPLSPQLALSVLVCQWGTTCIAYKSLKKSQI